MNASAFLHELWGTPPPGFVQLWDLRSKRSAYYSTTRIDIGEQPDLFTAMGTTAKRLGASQRARADQVCAISGVWLDLDIKPGAFHNRTQALSFANHYARPTITIDSGHGVHAYHLFPEPWVFRQISERDRAKTFVQQWVALHQGEAARRGIHLDSVGDLARLLRLPGSINAKDPADPRPVAVIEAAGPRHTYSDLARHLQHMPIVTPASVTRGTVDLRADASAFGAKLDALLANSPEFAAVWNGDRAFPSLSEADMSLCSLAAAAMNDAELVALIQANRARHGDEAAQAKGRREGYLRRTISRARSADQRAQLDGLARRAA